MEFGLITVRLRTPTSGGCVTGKVGKSMSSKQLTSGTGRFFVKQSDLRE